MRKTFNQIIDESIENYLRRNIITEKKHHKHSVEDEIEQKEEKEKEDREEKDYERAHPKETRKEKKARRIRKNALKAKSGLRKDFDIEDDKMYNYNVDDEEQNNIEDILTNGFVNVKKVAEKLYPDHTPEGAQSQLSKKLRGDKSDSGSTYKLKNREVKKLKQIISTEL
jgi:hypothetical protein